MLTLFTRWLDRRRNRRHVPRSGPLGPGVHPPLVRPGRGADRMAGDRRARLVHAERARVKAALARALRAIADELAPTPKIEQRLDFTGSGLTGDELRAHIRRSLAEPQRRRG